MTLGSRVFAIAVVVCTLAGACAWPPSRTAAVQDDPEEAALRAARVAAGMRPLARFLGDWEGTDESLRGSFRVARRLAWLVPDAFLLEQWRFLSTADGSEVARAANLYTYDPEVGRVRVEMLEAGGKRQEAWLEFSGEGLSWTLHLDPEGAASSRFLTTRFDDGVWEGTLLVADPEAPEGWRQAERISLRRRP